MKLKQILLLAMGVFMLAGVGHVFAADELPSGEHFGDGFTDASLVSISAMTAKPDDFYRKKIRTTGTIERQCPASGCWFFIKDAKGAEIQVELSDYFPKLPMNVGKSTMVEGEIVKYGDDNNIFVADRVTFFDKPYTPESETQPATDAQTKTDGKAIVKEPVAMEPMSQHDMSVHEMKTEDGKDSKPMSNKDMENCH